MLAAGILFLMISGCQKKDCFVPEGFILEVGTTDNSTYTSNLSVPDTVFHNTFHTTVRHLDLDGDQECELCLVSTETTINSTTIVRELKLVPDPSRTITVSVLVDNPNPPYLVRPYSVGATVDVEQEFSLLVNGDLPLARYTVDLLNGKEVFEGNWNGKSEKCLIIKYTEDGTELSAWIELSVTQYDNYVFHNFATFRKD